MCVGEMEFEGRLRARYKSFAEVTGNAEWASQRGSGLRTSGSRRESPCRRVAISRDARPRILGAEEQNAGVVCTGVDWGGGGTQLARMFPGVRTSGGKLQSRDACEVRLVCASSRWIEAKN